MRQTTLTQGSSPPRRNPRTGRPYRRVRDRVKQDQSLCPLCEAQGLTVAGEEVDHIVPLSRGGAEQDPANLQHLCVPCHNAKTQRQHPRRRAGATLHGDLVRPGGVKVPDDGVGGNRRQPEIFSAAKLSDARTEA